MKAVHPYLNFAGNSEEAFNFYKSVFGGEFTAVIRFKDMPMEGMTVSDEDSTKIMHISLPLTNNIILMATDTLESLGQKLKVGNNNYICLSPDTKEESEKIYEKLSDGGEIEMALGDVPWGSYFASFKDKFGVCWMIDYEYPKN
jgi:PhnB protein